MEKGLFIESYMEEGTGTKAVKSKKKSNLSQVVLMDISSIRPYQKNPRDNDEAVEAVAASIREFGFKVPIIVDKDLVIIAGHTRLKAAELLKLKQVPVIVANDLNNEQVKAFRLVDNRVAELSGWNMEMLEEELKEIESINMEEFGFDIDVVSGEDISDVEEDDGEPEFITSTCKTGQVWELGEHRLMCGDATKGVDLEQLMCGELADLLLTDPPYNVDYSSKNKFLNYSGKGNSNQEDIENDKMDSQDFIEFLIDAFEVAKEHMKQGACFYIWHSDMESLNFRLAVQQVGLKIRQCLVWVKNNFILGKQDYQWKHESCLYGWKEGATHYFVGARNIPSVIEDEQIDVNKLNKSQLQELCKQLIEDSQKFETTVIHESKPARSEEHPTMKPVKLFARQIKNSSRTGDIILDVFGGSGTTIIAAEQLNRKARIMELSPHYCDIIIARWEKLTGKQARLVK